MIGLFQLAAFAASVLVTSAGAQDDRFVLVMDDLTTMSVRLAEVTRADLKRFGSAGSVRVRLREAIEHPEQAVADHVRHLAEEGRR